MQTRTHRADSRIRMMLGIIATPRQVVTDVCCEAECISCFLRLGNKDTCNASGSGGSAEIFVVLRVFGSLRWLLKSHRIDAEAQRITRVSTAMDKAMPFLFSPKSGGWWNSKETWQEQPGIHLWPRSTGQGTGPLRRGAPAIRHLPCFPISP